MGKTNNKKKLKKKKIFFCNIGTLGFKTGKIRC